ncbi:MAG TPA: LUD domain-containing protein [Myxococcaceae bacterium]|nr:LUD domain-containing protein [Myxococcaceae bacterium]
MRSSRERVLALLRQARPPAMPLPDVPASPVRYEDLPARFAQSMTEVGGSCLRVPGLAEAAEAVRALPVAQSAKQIVSLVPDVLPGNLALDSVDDPHGLAGVDLALVPGQFGVAENGAVWLTDAVLKQRRAVLFVTQHLVLVVPARELVHTLHEAYGRLSLGAPGFGLFISGPSKTADIEQALVIGAHGARSTTVVLVG